MKPIETIWVSAQGEARLDGPSSMERLADAMERERERIERVRDQGRLPSECTSHGTAMVDMAPARGIMVPVRHHVIVEHAGGPRLEDTGYRGRAAARSIDTLDRVRDLTEAQRAAGRRYAALTELVSAGGVKCSKPGGVSGGATSREFMDVYTGHCDQLRRMHQIIGHGIGMAVRRVRPSVRGARVAISDRRLVDMICLGGHLPSAVLRAHGWAEKAETRRAVVAALADVLERLQ